MKNVVLSALLPLAIAASSLAAAQASAAERDSQFFRSVEGKWAGPGEIVAGKYKGTRFTCNFTGTTPGDKVGMTLDGGCRVGLFTQQMSATVQRKGRRGYTGSFMGGSSGTGLDIISGNVVNARKVVFSINRKKLNGVMQARLPDDNAMIVTVSVRVAEEMIPVIGMNLKRVDPVEIGSIARD